MNKYSNERVDQLNECCECNVIHQEQVVKMQKKMPKDEIIIDLAELFKVFGDSTRMKIICVLMEQEMCVCDISCVIGASVSATSHQLRILKQAKLVKFQKKGKVVYYSLDDEHVKEIYQKGLEHVEEM